MSVTPSKTGCTTRRVKGAHRAQFDAGRGLAGALGIESGKAIDAVAPLLGVVETQQADAVGIEKVKMRKVGLLAQCLEHRAPDGQKTVGVIFA